MSALSSSPISFSLDPLEEDLHISRVCLQAPRAFPPTPPPPLPVDQQQRGRQHILQALPSSQE